MLVGSSFGGAVAVLVATFSALHVAADIAGLGLLDLTVWLVLVGLGMGLTGLAVALGGRSVTTRLRAGVPRLRAVFGVVLASIPGVLLLKFGGTAASNVISGVSVVGESASAVQT